MGLNSFWGMKPREVSREKLQEGQDLRGKLAALSPDEFADLADRAGLNATELDAMQVFRQSLVNTVESNKHVEDAGAFGSVVEVAEAVEDAMSPRLEGHDFLHVGTALNKIREVL